MCYLSPVIPHFPDFLPTLLQTGPSSSDIPHPIPPPTSSIPQGSILSPLPGGAERSLGLITPSAWMMPRLQLWLKFRTGFLIPEIPYLSPGCLRSILNSACFIFSWLFLPNKSLPQGITQPCTRLSKPRKPGWILNSPTHHHASNSSSQLSHPSCPLWYNKK